MSRQGVDILFGLTILWMLFRSGYGLYCHHCNTEYDFECSVEHLNGTTEQYCSSGETACVEFVAYKYALLDYLTYRSCSHLDCREWQLIRRGRLEILLCRTCTLNMCNAEGVEILARGLGALPVLAVIFVRLNFMA